MNNQNVSTFFRFLIFNNFHCMTYFSYFQYSIRQLAIISFSNSLSNLLLSVLLWQPSYIKNPLLITHNKINLFLFLSARSNLLCQLLCLTHFYFQLLSCRSKCQNLQLRDCFIHIQCTVVFTTLSLFVSFPSLYGFENTFLLAKLDKFRNHNQTNKAPIVTMFELVGALYWKKLPCSR